jgi:hypothetical protein
MVTVSCRSALVAVDDDSHSSRDEYVVGQMEEQMAAQAQRLADEFERIFHAEQSGAGQPEPGEKASMQAPSFKVPEALDRVRSREDPNRTELGATVRDNYIRSRRSMASGITKAAAACGGNYEDGHGPQASFVAQPTHHRGLRQASTSGDEAS